MIHHLKTACVTVTGIAAALMILPKAIALPAITSIAGGANHTLFTKADGSLWAMGDNFYGQLGIGAVPTTTNQPVEIVPSGVTLVSAGGDHTLFTKSDGSLWAMGYNGQGQLGDNTTSNWYTPEQVAFNGVTAIAGGGSHSLFLKSDGSLWGMGNNSVGQLGDGTTNTHLVPFQIVASNVVAVAAGGGHSLFIKSDGSLWGMGQNDSGQLGDGSYSNHLSPFEIVSATPPAPGIVATGISGSNLNLTCSNGVPEEIVYTLTSADLSQPLSQWQPIATNVLTTAGNFSITATNAISPGAPQQFYILRGE